MYDHDSLDLGRWVRRTLPDCDCAEEKRLDAIYGSSFSEYRLRTPAFLPAVHQFRHADDVTINMRSFGKGVRDCLWFVLATIAVHINAELHEAGLGFDLGTIW
ncbi:MAG: hypothetical protein QM811_31785 [Pirellulales bacterium]